MARLTRFIPRTRKKDDEVDSLQRAEPLAGSPTAEAPDRDAALDGESAAALLAELGASHADRRDFLEQVDARLKRGAVAERGCAIVWFCLDPGEEALARLGETASDALVMAATARLNTTLRPGDALARVGPTEFAILLAEVDGEQDAARIAVRLGARLREPFFIGGERLTMTPSVGLAVSRVGETSAEDLLERARAPEA